MKSGYANFDIASCFNMVSYLKGSGLLLLFQTLGEQGDNLVQIAYYA